MSRLASFVVVAVFAAASTVAVAIYTLRVTAIEVVGTEALQPGDVLAASGVHAGERILWLRTSEVAARVEAFPGVASVDVQRRLPGTLIIRVTERAAAVFLEGTRGLAADGSGMVFARRATPGIPVLAGWHGRGRPGTALDPASRVVVGALHDFPPRLLARIRRITLFGSVTMILDDGTEIRFGQTNDLLLKARAAEAVLAVAVSKHEKLAYVDVRAPGAPASRGRTPPSPTPSPQGSTTALPPGSPAGSPTP